MTKALMLAREARQHRTRRRVIFALYVAFFLAFVSLAFIKPKPKPTWISGDFTIFTAPTPQVEMPTDKNWRGI